MESSLCIGLGDCGGEISLARRASDQTQPSFRWLRFSSSTPRCGRSAADLQSVAHLHHVLSCRDAGEARLCPRNI